MSEEVLFQKFNKIPRLSRDIIITEKLDGTNGQILITEQGDVYAGSRNRFITVENDNYGFAAWVDLHKEELCELGPGRHFGEWWGCGINRGYELSEKRFSLFNVKKWGEQRPDCCDVVPVLYTGEFTTEDILLTLGNLAEQGSWAAPGYKYPEGIIIYHEAANMCFKKTIKDDEKPKGKLMGGGSS